MKSFGKKSFGKYAVAAALACAAVAAGTAPAFAQCNCAPRGAYSFYNNYPNQWGPGPQAYYDYYNSAAPDYYNYAAPQGAYGISVGGWW
jgi:hypothetical protein